MVFLNPGTVVDKRYRIIGSLGAGGMGAVFKAQELGLDRLVAIKLLHSTLAGDPQNQARFKREGKALATLSHPNIIQMYRYGTWEDKYLYIAMEYFNGRPLDSLVNAGVPLECQTVLSILTQVCNAMEAAHSAGIVHRDLSLANVMLPEEGDRPAKVIDFGLSMFSNQEGTAGQKLTSTGTVVGSIYYMSPEQCTGDRADHRADIYSLGCVAYHMLTGEAPFQADNPIALMRKHTSEYPPALQTVQPSLPIGLSSVIAKAMAKEPSQRYQSMGEMRNDIDLVLSGLGASIEAPVHPGSYQTAARKHAKVVLGSTLVLFVGITAMLMYYAYAKKQSEQVLHREEAPSSLRALKERSELNSIPVDDQIAYYRSWLAAHASDKKVDAAIARRGLAHLLFLHKPESKIDAKLLDSEALEMAKPLLIQSIDRSNPSQAELIINMTKEMDTDSPIPNFLERMSEMRSVLEQKGEEGMLKPCIACRNFIAERLCTQKRFAEAEKVFAVQLESSTQGPILHVECMRWMIMRARCLVCLERESEARDLLRDTISYARKNVPGQPLEKTDLAGLCYEANQFRLAIAAADLACAACPNVNNSYMTATETKYRSLMKLGEYANAYQTISSTYDRVHNAQVRLHWLKFLSQSNTMGKLEKSEEIKRFFQVETNRLSPSAQGDVSRYFNSVVCAATDSRMLKNEEPGRSVMHIASSVIDRMTPADVQANLGSLIAFFVECYCLKDKSLTVEVLDKTWAKVEKLPGNNFFVKAKLAAFYANYAGYFDNGKFRDKYLNSIIAQTTDEKTRQQVAFDLLLTRSRLLRFENKPKLALRDAEDALSRSRELQDNLGEACALREMGVTEFMLGNFEEAEKYQRLAVAKNAQAQQQKISLLALITTLMRLKKYQDSEQLLNECKALDVKSHTPLHRWQILQLYSSLYKDTKQPDKLKALAKPIERAKEELLNPKPELNLD